jgi:TIR domain
VSVQPENRARPAAEPSLAPEIEEIIRGRRPKKEVLLLVPDSEDGKRLVEALESSAPSPFYTVVTGHSPFFGREFAKMPDIIVIDISDGDPDLLVFAGMAIGLQKPVILLVREGQWSKLAVLQFGGIPLWNYEPTDFIPRFVGLVSRAILHPGTFMGKEPDPGRTHVFICYSHKDRDYLDRLLVHLKPLQREQHIDLWVDTQLRGGERWREAIGQALARARVAILLVSADFLASEFIANDELPPLLKQEEDKGTTIIPFVLRACGFTRDPHLGKFHAFNEPDKPLELLAPGFQEVWYNKLAREIETLTSR